MAWLRKPSLQSSKEQHTHQNWITIVGGVLNMMGHQTCSEALFYYFRLEDQVPETHQLRLIEKHISFAFVRERLKA